MAPSQPPDPARRWRLFVVVSALLSLVGVHGPLIGYKTFANIDEAYAGALAERLLEGQKLYQGAVSQRGPLMYYAFEGLAWLHGWDNIVALRVWALLLAFAHVGLVYWAGARLFSKNAAAVAAGVTGYALAFGFPPADAIAINGEPLQMPAFLLAVVLGALAVRHAPLSRARVVRLAAAGLLFGVAIATKQSAALHPAAVVVWLAVDAHRRRAGVRPVVLETLLLTAATLLVPALLVAHAAATGTLPELVYYCFTYNSTVHLRPTTKTLAWLPFFYMRLADQTAFFGVTALLGGRAIPFLARRVRAARASRSAWALARGFGAAHYVALNFVIALFAASSMFRFFPHYYLQALPFLALCIGAAVAPFFRRRRTARAARTLVSAFMAFTLFACALGCVFGERIDGRVAHDRTVQDMGRLIAATTAPEDRIFVWGFSSWLYQYSHRRPAGRYVFETYVTGFVPWFWEKLDVESARIVPRSQEALLGDLDRERPVAVVDAGSIMIARPMRHYEKFNTWLHAHYCFDVRIGALDLYRRKARDADACTMPFPKPHETIDWMGRAMPIVMPKTVDFEQSRMLPRGNYLKPLWFVGAPEPRGLAAVRDAKMEKEEAEAERDGFWVPKVESDTVVPLGPAPAPPSGAP